jgi:ribonuclease P protein component
MGKFTFRKRERLKKELWIQELFQKGSSFHLYPFRVLAHPHPAAEGPAHQLLVSVSARNFKKAPDRNRVKRRVREAYRLNKHLLPAEPKWLIAYIYTAKEILPSAIIHEKMAATLAKIGASTK